MRSLFCFVAVPDRRAISVMAITVLLSISVPAQRPRSAARSDPARSDSDQRLSPRETLEQARNAPTPNERIALLEKFIAANSGTAIAVEAREVLMREYALRAEQKMREGNAEGALADFKAGFRSAPSEITERIFSQYVFPMPVAMNAFGLRAESVELMRLIEARFQNDVNRLIQIGFFYVQIEAPLEAVRALERAVQLAPNDSRGHNSLGTAYLINLRLDESLAEFRRALELNPKDEFANVNMANLLRSRGQHERAVSYYRKQLVLKADDAEALGGLAISLLALGQDEESEKLIARASELAPDNYRFFTQLSYFYASRKRFAHARTAVERAGRIEPRYAWAHIVKANIDALEGRLGDSLATLIPAQNLGSFPTLSFEVVKALMALDGYDQALEIMQKAFTVTEDGEFEALLGGVLKARSQKIELLLERERHAALFLNEQLTTPFQYRLAETLAQIDHNLKLATAARKPRSPAQRAPGPASTRGRSRPPAAKTRPAQTKPAETEEADELKSASRPRRTAALDLDAPLTAGPDAALPGVAELLKVITTFTTLDDGRQPFRMLWAARKLSEAGVALDAAEQLAQKAIAVAEQATEPAGSMRDAPLLDRQGRLQVFLGRAEDILGWTLLRKGDTRGAIAHLTKAIDVYPNNAERKGALWHLAVAMEEVGDEPRALELYIAGFDPTLPTAATRRIKIEGLYKKAHGSLAGLDERLKLP